jgi:tRNA(fMet)-specific endonuclease VapC
MAKVTLDTNAYSAFMQGDEQVLDAISEASSVYLPLFVIGELHYGFRGGNRLQENLAQLKAFLGKPTVKTWLPTVETAQIYGEIQDRLKRDGTPIPINDIWIASSCVEAGSTLITYDKHFLLIPSIRTWQFEK